MRVLDRINSAVRFLTAQQRQEHAPSPSEAAIVQLAQRMGVQLPRL